MEENHEGGISRRRVLKGLGAGTAVAWTAPVLMSIGSPAYAQASPTCDPFDCANQRHCTPGGNCGPPPECGGCTELLDGSCRCWSHATCSPCQSDADCQPGYRCGRIVNCCGDVEQTCFNACGSNAPVPRGGLRFGDR
jgi:hypothetical protein